MKIDRRTSTRLPLQNVPAPTDNNVRKDAGVQGSNKPGSSISAMARVLASPEPFDTQKVEELKQLIAKGEYEVDVEVLAKKLLSEIMRGTEQ